MPPTKSCLSAHDQQVLESIFNPLELTSSLSSELIIPDSIQPLKDNDEDFKFDGEVLKQSKLLEISAVKLAEDQELEKALETFLEASNLTPNRPSILNNRAQALRLAGRDEGNHEHIW